MYHRESISALRNQPTKYGYPLPKALQMQKQPLNQYVHPLVPSSLSERRFVPPSTTSTPLNAPRANVVSSYCSSTNGRLPCFMKNFQ